MSLFTWAVTQLIERDIVRQNLDKLIRLISAKLLSELDKLDLTPYVSKKDAFRQAIIQWKWVLIHFIHTFS